MSGLGNQTPVVIRRGHRKADHGHHGGAWKVAYADFVTALMAFFMLLWLLATPDKEKLKGIAEYFTPQPPTATGLTGDRPGLGGRSEHSQSDTVAPVGQLSIQAASDDSGRNGSARIPDSALRVLAQELRIALASVPDPDAGKKAVRLTSDRSGLRVNFMDVPGRTMFRPGTADLNAYGRERLTTLARKVSETGTRIAIEGHTDSVGGQTESNWRLSGERAQAARAVMMGAGLTADRFAEVVAKAGTEPIFPDQPDRPENRRITVVILAEAQPLPADVNLQF